MITNDAAASLAINPTEHVKSISSLSYDGNALMMDGISLADIAKSFGTPTYVY
ncbi:MAG: diaminopimelate decarboxylase, partial [Moraxella osloensis]|nr:diaminopimelate decarboxylase [Moraxella osloensis]